MSGADLFVVCKNCQSEVSPYVTECPYCGTRLRKRAPKLEPGGTPPRPRPSRSRPSLGRLRPNEIPGIRADTRPWVTIALVLATCGVWILWRGGYVSVADMVVAGPLDGEWWRVLTTQFVFLSGLAQFFSLIGLGLFGWLVERRWGWPVVVAVFLAAGAGGTAVVTLVDDFPVAVGGTGAALGLLCMWAVPQLLARRGGEETDSDMLGVAAIAFVLAAMPIARTEIDPLAVLCGALIGALAGMVVGRSRTPA
jgi:membrane associated rhomboid family serine protease